MRSTNYETFSFIRVKFHSSSFMLKFTEVFAQTSRTLLPYPQTANCANQSQVISILNKFVFQVATQISNMYQNSERAMDQRHYLERIQRQQAPGH